MRTEYELSKAVAVLLVKEQFHLQNKRHKSIGRLIILLAVSYGLYAAFADPPQASPGETLTPHMQLILLVCVQFPLIAGITYLILKCVHALPLKLIKWRIDRQPDENFGERILTISDDSIAIEQGPSTLSVKKSYIDELIVGESGLHLMHEGKAVFMIPRSVFSAEELRQEVLTS